MDLADAIFTLSVMISSNCCANDKNPDMVTKTTHAIMEQYGDIIEDQTRSFINRAGIREEYLVNTVMLADLAMQQRLSHSIPVFDGYSFETIINGKKESIGISLKKTF